MNEEDYQILKECDFEDFTNKIIVACARANNESDLLPKLKEFTKVLEAKL